LESNLSEILPVYSKFIRGSTLTESDKTYIWVPKVWPGLQKKTWKDTICRSRNISRGRGGTNLRLGAGEKYTKYNKMREWMSWFL